jgi:hypothetical protein
VSLEKETRVDQIWTSFALCHGEEDVVIGAVLIRSAVMICSYLDDMRR